MPKVKRTKMRRNIKLTVTLVAIIAAVSFALTSSCGRDASEKQVVMTNKGTWYDGFFEERLERKDGSVWIFTTYIKDERPVETTITDENGKPVENPPVCLKQTFVKEDAHVVFREAFKEYDCVYMMVGYQRDFPRSGDNYFYAVYASGYDENGDCFYD